LNAISIRNLLQRVGEIIDIEPIIQDDPAMPAPVPVRYVSDTTRVEKELDWRPQVAVEHGLQMIL
jgi:nucleoside-diphosphate-sugar epimerase